MWDTILGFAGLGANAFNAQSKIASDQKIAEMNIANQKEFAQQGIRWKVADAQAAGLHPLAALGAQTSSFSNVVGSSGDTNDYAAMGQNIGRSIDAGSTQSERTDRMGAAIARTAEVFKLENMNLQNEQLKSQIALTRAQTPPAIPGDVPSGALAHLSRSPQRTTEGHPIEDKKIEQQASDAPAYKAYKFLGLPLQSNPYASDAQVLEDRLGDSEILSTIAAIGNLFADAGYTYMPKPNPVPHRMSAHERRWRDKHR